jgi:uncharacterized membrane protein YidH (DUF202 family)
MQPSQAAEHTADGTRRTRLANERTYLACWRTGFAAFAVSIGAGKLVPALTHAPRWPYLVLGAGFALLGVSFTGYGVVRNRLVDRAITRGSFALPDEKIVADFAATGMLLGTLLLVLLIID